MNSRVSAFLLGAVSGMRSMSAPAVVSYKLRRRGGSPHFLTGSRTVSALGLAAAAELIVDKLPGTPARTAPPALIARIFSGAFAGALVSSPGRRERVLGALLGAAGAVTATYGMYHLRKIAVAKSKLPDSIFAVVEDAATLTLAWKTAA